MYLKPGGYISTIRMHFLQLSFHFPFFAEEVNEQRGSFNGMTVNHQYMIYHSTPNCKAIKNGVAMDRAYTDSTYRMSNSKFCPKCMDKMLIQKCERFLQNDFDN